MCDGVFVDRLVATRAILRKLLGDERTAERRIKALITNERDLATMMENLASNMILNDIKVPVTDIATLVQIPMIKYFGPEVATSLLYEGLYNSSHALRTWHHLTGLNSIHQRLIRISC